jgi:hypothetical protein
MEELKGRNEYVKATNKDGVAILEGTATWCSQCKAIAPCVDQVYSKWLSMVGCGTLVNETQLVKKYPDAR